MNFLKKRLEYKKQRLNITMAYKDLLLIMPFEMIY